jgi:hypothetical protein
VLKTMLLTNLKPAVAVLLSVGVVGLGAGAYLQRPGATGNPDDRAGQRVVEKPAGQSAAAAQPPAGQPKVPEALSAQAIRDRLARPITLERGFEPNTPLRDALDLLGEHHASGLTILVNQRAFQEDAGINDLEQQPVRLPKMVNVPLGTILRLVADQVNGTYVIRPGYLELTTVKRTQPEEWLRGDRSFVPRVSADFDKIPLDQALRELSERTGINIVLDARSAERATKTPVTATLTNVAPDTAVRVLADMADLKPVALDSVLYVTSKPNAEALQAEQERLRALRGEREKAEKKASPESSM